MKILHAILSQGFYGSERYCVELASAQAQAGHEVALLVRDAAADQALRRMIAAAAGPDRPPPVIRTVALPRWTSLGLTGIAARRLLSEIKPDIVHTHLPQAARRIGREAQKLGIPNVATLHIGFDRADHAKCDGVICIAAWQRKALPADFSGEVALVPNWLPQSISQALDRVTPDDVAALRSAWRADDTTIVFGCAGRLMPEKGMDRLIRCFRASFPFGTEPARVVVAGDGPMRDDIEELCGRDARVFLVGMQTEIAAVYRAIDVYVSAARFEPFGLAIIEAMAAGLPLVLTRTEGPREFVTDARVRWTEPEDEATLVEHMRAAITTGRGRFSYDLSAFAPEKGLAAIERFYKQVLARGSGR
jgi:glycosyltransferase involved in cell wall biosynthesis